MCALLVTGTVLTGCAEDPNEGTNGVGRLPAGKIQSKTRTAAESAGAVRVHGSVVSGEKTYALDMRLKDDGGEGSVTTEGTTFQLLRIGEQLFLKADAGFWSHGDGQGGKGDGDAASKLGGKFVKVPQGDPAYKKFSGFTDKGVLLDGLLTLHGTLATDGHEEQAGVRTIRITGDKGSGGALEVSLEGKPYPLRLERAGGAGTLTFSAWGEDFSLREPERNETVDYGRQLPTS
ncbi:lipoprotein [Streptomyces violaceus]|nr:lipoprotein [Streptomyces janthinus]